MLKNYFKIAWRNLMNNKGYSGINIVGLGTGMAVAILIGLWIMSELSFDHYHKNHEHLAQVMHGQVMEGEKEPSTSSVVPLATELRTSYPQDIKRLSLTWGSTNILAVGDKKISQSGMWAQPDFPSMLTLDMLKGKYEGFNGISSILLSKTAAMALFGGEDPLNKSVRVDNKMNLTVGGIYQDLPRNSTFYGTNFLLPFDNDFNYWNTEKNNWENHGCQLYVQLNDHSSTEKISAKIRDIMLPHLSKYKAYTFLHPMDKWHLYSDFGSGKADNGAIRFVWLFGFIGFFVLLLACINFMNLSTARSEKRAKEVGIRKTVGSLRSQLIAQFISESIALTFLAAFLAIMLVWISLPFFNKIADKEISLPWNAPMFWISILGFILFTGLISGSYPAFYLSGFNPVKVLKGTFKAGRFASLPRKVLVVVQFTVSIILIIGTVIVYRQVQFARDRPIGYNRDRLISVVMNTPELYQHYNAMRDELIESGAAENLAESNSSPTMIWSNNGGFDWNGKDPALGMEPVFGTIAVTHDFGKTVGWKIAEGRDFSRSYPTDTGAFILNESAVKLAGITNPVGKTMRWLDQDHLIVGVVKDMIMESPYEPTIPTVFHMQYGWANMITVKLNPTLPVREALNKSEKVFRKYNPGSPFEYKFVDDEYGHKFATEQRIGNLCTVFAILAIFISCLGLFGMASFTAEQRVKEIGVRKVLGATVFRLWRLLSKEFILLVIISLSIAVPVAYYFMQNWLQNYQYRTSLPWWIFATAGIGAIGITILTVSFKAIKAAIANPVKSLRTE